MELRHIATRAGRLSSFLREEMGLSAGIVNRLKWQQKLFVNGTAQFTNYTVVPGDIITVPMNEPAPDYPAEDGPLQILYEDEHFLAVDKPAGILIHPSHHCNTGTLANFVTGYYQKTGQSFAFHPITRLDRDTFGVVLLAKTAHIHATMQLPEHSVQKTYHALVLGMLDPACGSINAPIARCSAPSLLRQVHPEGQASLTQFQLLQSFDGYCKLALQPITGRTHQLRVHCAYIGHPILGDPQYNTPASVALSQTFLLASQQLCAHTIRWTHPVSGQQLEVLSGMDTII